MAKLGWQSTPGAALVREVERRIQGSALGNRQVGRRRREQGRAPFVLSIYRCQLVTEAARPSTTTLSELWATVNSPWERRERLAGIWIGKNSIGRMGKDNGKSSAIHVSLLRQGNAKLDCSLVDRGGHSCMMALCGTVGSR